MSIEEPHDMGKMILGLQDQLNTIKEKIKGLDTGYLPQLPSIATQMERVQSNLKLQSEQLLQKLLTGETVQDLSNKPPIKKSTLSAAGELHVKPPNQTYVKIPRGVKKSLSVKRRRNIDEEEVACITENDISKGLFNLMNKGVIPKDVDLTPAFVRGAPPLSNKAVTIYPGSMKPGQVFVRSDNQSQAIKFDFSYNEPKRNNKIATKQTKPAKVDMLFGESFKDTSNTRGYEELMDTFSSHLFIIRKGQTLDTTPEFISFQRTYLGIWSKILPGIKALESMLSTFKVPKAIADGKKLVDLIGKKYKEEELLDCIVNKEEVREFIKIPRIQYQGQFGKAKAAVKIQSVWRMYKAKTSYKQLMFLMGKARIIQAAFRRFLEVKNTRKQAANRFKQKMLEWKSIQNKFKLDWPSIKTKKRLEIHISSLSIDELRRLTMDKFLVRQNIQLSRIFTIQDPNVDILFVSAFEMSPEIIGYYTKILELGNIKEVNSRLTLLSPDYSSCMPTHLSTTRALLYSPKSISAIRAMTKHRTAYIVPGVMSKDEVELSVLLKVPVLGGDPYKTCLYSTKSGCKRILSAAEVPIPIGTSDIYDEKELVATLTRLIASNLYVDIWIFKIDNEFGGRGHASIDLSSSKIVKSFRKTGEKLSEETQEELYNYLLNTLPKKVKIAMPSIYPSWKEYLKEFTRVGGVIEASPLCASNKIQSAKVTFCIYPDGNIALIGAYDKLEPRKYISGGYFFPQTSLPNMNLQMLAVSIGNVLYEKDVIGYVNVDLVSFPDDSEKSGHPLFWAVDLDCSASDSGAVMHFFDFLMEGILDPVTGFYNLNTPTEDKIQSSRFFLYIPYLHHPGLGKVLYKTFFYMCRVQGISFDLEDRKGTAFLLPDSLQSCVLGIMSMGNTQLQVLKMMGETLDFVGSQGGIGISKTGFREESRDDNISFSEIMSMVKIQQKKLKPKPKRKENDDRLIR
jgi:IQ domain-containing protein H